MKIKTNNRKRPILTYSDLGPLQQKELEKQMEGEADDWMGFVYRGFFEPIGQFSRTYLEDSKGKKWYPSFDCPYLVVQLFDDSEVIVGQFVGG